MKIHASGVLGFSFAWGRRPQAKLNPRTKRSDLEEQGHVDGACKTLDCFMLFKVFCSNMGTERDRKVLSGDIGSCERSPRV